MKVILGRFKGAKLRYVFLQDNLKCLERVNCSSTGTHEIVGLLSERVGPCKLFQVFLISKFTFSQKPLTHSVLNRTRDKFTNFLCEIALWSC